MAYTLERLADDCRQALRDHPDRAGREQVRQHLQQALADRDFVNSVFTGSQQREREVAYEDPELGFCICLHVYAGAAHGQPHDHGPTWAIYGQAEGETSMTDWEIVSEADNDQPAQVALSRRYKLSPGDVHLYEPGDVHAPYRDGPTKLVRIEGENCDRIKRTPIIEVP